MKYYLLLIISVLFLQQAFTQTKAIAYKSHSGAKQNYAKALKTDHLLAAEAGYGLPAYRTYRYIKSVQYLTPGTVVIVTAYYQGDFMDTIATDFIRNVSDTIKNDPLFNNPHLLDSIKKVMKERYKFGYKIEEAKYIGFDNIITKKKKQKKENAVVGIIATEKTNAQPPAIISVAYAPAMQQLPGIDLKLFLYLLFFSLFAGWLTWKFYRPFYRQSM